MKNICVFKSRYHISSIYFQPLFYLNILTNSFFYNNTYIFKYFISLYCFFHFFHRPPSKGVSNKKVFLLSTNPLGQFLLQSTSQALLPHTSNIKFYLSQLSSLLSYLFQEILSILPFTNIINFLQHLCLTLF